NGSKHNSSTRSKMKVAWENRTVETFKCDLCPNIFSSKAPKKTNGILCKACRAKQRRSNWLMENGISSPEKYLIEIEAMIGEPRNELWLYRRAVNLKTIHHLSLPEYDAL